MAFRVRSTESTSVLDPVPCLAFGKGAICSQLNSTLAHCFLFRSFFVKVAINTPAIELFKDQKEMRRNHHMTCLPCASRSRYYRYVSTMPAAIATAIITGPFLKY